MGIIRKFLGPKSKYDPTIPFTYVAKVSIIPGNKDLANHFFSDTICGLIEYLDENLIKPEEVELFGCYKKKEISIDKKYCLDIYGKWLKRPDLCRSLEAHYKETLEEQYKGHIEHGDCSFDDRDRQAIGPQ